MSSKSSSSNDRGWFKSASMGKRAVSRPPSISSLPSNNISSITNKQISPRKQAALQEDLPLDWTRVKRRRVECAIGYNTRTLTKSPLVVSDKERVYHGYAIFCLHDSTNPTWFQGYFLETALDDSSTDGDGSSSTMIHSSRRPWGLLATKEEIDECMECENGGYRRITVKIFHAPSSNISSPQTTSLTGVDWTGGDMMRLSNDKVEMNTQRLLTGKDALPYLNQYFSGMLRKLQQACSDAATSGDNDNDENDKTGIFTFLPDVAVLVGKMSIVSLQDVNTVSRETQSISVEEKNKDKHTKTDGKNGGDLWDD
ncbi:MAG: hypothetical protein SGBAC_011652 [Bacillariaceae sp.]